MPFIPHTQQETREMLAAVGVERMTQLFDEIPASLHGVDTKALPEALNEMQITRLMEERAPSVEAGRCFIGAGAYEHHIPAAVWQVASRGEFYTAYTPYQAEASQGSLQLIYEYQTMMSELMALEVSNASLYDGSTALAEAVAMAVRIKGGGKTKVLLPRTVNPAYRKVLSTILKQQGIETVSVELSPEAGTIHADDLMQHALDEVAALVVSQPNFLGCLEEVDYLTNWAHQHNLLLIAVVNPLAMALIKPPGDWGDGGADIACGEGQPLGVPLSYGGPYFGFLCCKKQYVRQMPGRVVGKTQDRNGKTGYVLTLQAREQHIRRQKATSNICTNQGLMVVAATIYMSLLGQAGLHQNAHTCHQNAVILQNQLEKIPGVTRSFSAPYWHEFVVQLPQPVGDVVAKLRAKGIEAGYDITADYPELGNALMICVTEVKTLDDIKRYAKQLKEALHG